MEIKTLKNGFSLPEVGLGTWLMGGALEVDTSRDSEWIEVIRQALIMGYTHIDSAALYGAGHAEELVAQAVVDFDREKLAIATKVFATELAYDDFINSVQESKKRLNLDCIDLLYIHAPSLDIPLSETMRAMDDLVAEGIIKNIAVSNFTVSLLKEAQSYTKNKIVANQIEYNLGTREQSTYEGCVHMESEILPYCQENDIFVVAYRPVDRGILLEANPLMDELSLKYKKTRAQIAINWLISQKNVVTIPMSENPVHLKENFESSGWSMDSVDVERLRTEYPVIR